MPNPSLSALPGTVAARSVSAVLLLTPATVLGLAAFRYGSGLLAAGATAALIGGLLYMRYREVWKPPASGSVILLYLIALGWLWVFTRFDPDSFSRAGRGVFLLVAVGLLIRHDLARTGLGPRRVAASLCRRVRSRTRWPAQVEGYAKLPEVQALREVVRDDPGPVIEMLADPRPTVRTAAFTALAARRVWRPAESAAVMAAIRRSPEPLVRAAGVAALGGSADAEALSELATFLRDQALEVRRAAALALLSTDGHRWPTARDAVRDALADPLLAADGPLPGAAGRLPALAVCDLTTWASEGEPLAGRSVRTLVEHYAVVLRSGGYPELPVELGQEVIDPQTPTALRVELAGLLRELGLIYPELLDRMTDVDQPGPIRLLAAEMLLAQTPDDSDAVDVLRGLGRQPNRETALAIARLLQKYQGIDFGLPADAWVAPSSKLAADTAKRVLEWATGRPAPPPPSEAGSAWVARPASQPALPGLKPTHVPRPRRSREAR